MTHVFQFSVKVWLSFILMVHFSKCMSANSHYSISRLLVDCSVRVWVSKVTYSQ